MAITKRKVGFIAKSAVAACVPLALVFAVQTGLYSYKEYVDQFLGSGEKHVVSSNGLDGNYINYSTKSQAEALANAQAVTKQSSDEGMILLKNKNNALPLASSEKLTLLGYYGWHHNQAGGEDPDQENRGTKGYSLYRGLEKKFSCNPYIRYQSNSSVIKYTDSCPGTSDYFGSNGDIAENQVESKLNQYADSYNEYNTAVITLKRNSGEGNDQTIKMGASENERTGLTINRAEMELIDYANKHFSKVIILINSANTMELGFLDENDPNMTESGGRTYYKDPYSNKEIDVTNIVGAFWVGCCGNQAGLSIADLFDGTVNPSGHTPDIYARDLTKDPTYQNFGSYKYSNSTALNSYAQASYFVEYEEDIYIGYRYHETAAAEAAKNNYEGYNYDNAVVYPFGYGKSYTTFTQEYATTPVYNAETESFTFQVKVTNTGSKAGKGVAQIYVNVPYANGQVEKAHVVLGGFAKTEVLAPDASETVTIEVKKDYFTSYDYITEKAYLLDAGDYNFYLAYDELGSHSWATIDAEADATEKAKRLYTYNQANKVVYNAEHGKRVTDKIVATNIMDDETNYKFKSTYGAATVGDGYIHNFTRSDFKGSFPTAPDNADYILSDARAKEQIARYNVWADSEQNGVDEQGNPITEMPKTNVDKTNYNLAEMRGVPFDDPKWDDFIDQFTVESMAYMFSNGGWQAPADTDNGVPKSWDTDSPYGYYGAQLTINNVNCFYVGGPMLAATFNTKLAKEVGEAFAEEAWWQKQTDGAPITGLYGFGMNQHRSAFGGRNYEYYSEDPVLCGKIGMSEASGCSEKGMVVYMKHFVLNDQETNRQANGYCAWVNEQAYREVYLRGWEIYMKEATMSINYYAYDEATDSYKMATTTMPAATGIMTCYNRVGATYGGASVSINGILRNEWNFRGTVLTDAGGEPDTYMTTDLALRRGQNLTLCNNGTQGLYDTESKTAVWWLKNSTKYLLYNKANSNIVVGLAPGDYIYYDMAPWQVGVIVAWVVAGLIAAAAVTLDVLVCLDKITLKEKAKRDEFDY